MTRVIAFDVNETLLDLAALDAPFAELLGSAELRPQWFAQMLQLAFVGGLTGRYVDFGTAQRAALSMVAERAGQVGSVENRKQLVEHPAIIAVTDAPRKRRRRQRRTWSAAIR